MELGENESLADIRQQTERLRSLTDDLVMLTRMEEPGNTMQKIDFPLSEVVAEAAHPFRTLAIQQGKEFVCHIQPVSYTHLSEAFPLPLSGGTRVYTRSMTKVSSST